MNLIARVIAAVFAAVVMVCGCSEGTRESPTINEDIPVIDIAELPDLDQTRVQLLDLIERVRAEVVRVVPATDPWVWRRDESSVGCVQKETGHKGATLQLRLLVSERALDDTEWNEVFPAVERLAAKAGLTAVWAPQNSTGNHDVRIHQ